ncbi:MAG: hypothetical protein KDC38_03875 [Planctomycetes bacterium]|nr:hypothetical protein [Planctomycetota bacterium]
MSCRLGTIAVLALSLSGCTLMYQHRVVRDDLAVYGDDDPDRLESTAKFIERAMRGFEKVFPIGGPDVPSPRVVFETDALARKNVYLPTPRQEGYYLPMLRLVHLSPQIIETSSDAPREVEQLESARVVILHELSHHFLISVFPESNSKYWLNEGFACVIETGRLDEDDRLQIPYFHPWLHRRARVALLGELGTEGFLREVRRLIDASWMTFHRQGNKTRNYALSYVSVCYLLEHLEGPLEERLRLLLSLSTDELMARLEGLPMAVAQPPAVRLSQLAQSPAHRAWALEQWLELGGAEIEGLSTELHRSLASPNEEERVLGSRLAARLVSGDLAETPAARLLAASLLQRLRDGRRPAEQRAIADEIIPSGFRGAFLAPLIDLLESADPDLRVAASGALTRSRVKPTIARPEFWRSADPGRRRAEIREWRRWIQHYSIRSDERINASLSTSRRSSISITQ